MSAALSYFVHTAVKHHVILLKNKGLADISDIKSFRTKLDKTVNDNGNNMFYVVKVSGTFDKTLVRIWLKQENPYNSLDKDPETASF